MKTLWNRTPLRLRAALAALALVLALLTLWGSVGWAVPSPRLALRLAERECAFGPGEIVVDEPFALQESTPLEGSSGRWLVSRKDGRFVVAVLEPKLLFLWRRESATLLSPSEDYPLQSGFIAFGTIISVSGGETTTVGLEDILFVCSSDPDIVSVDMVVESTKNVYNDPDAPRETTRTVVPCTPVGEQVWVAQVVIPGNSGSGFYARGYGADGALIYDSSLD